MAKLGQNYADNGRFSMVVEFITKLKRIETMPP